MSSHSDRLALSIAYRRREGFSDVELTDHQIALVCRAMADHTQIMSALQFSLPRQSDHPWPHATSVGRFFHHLADEFTAASPKPECICPYTDPSTWLSAASLGYGSGYEPGSTQEWDPDCPAHPPRNQETP